MVCDGFDLKHRVHIDMTTIQWKVLAGLAGPRTNVFTKRLIGLTNECQEEEEKRGEVAVLSSPW